MNLFYLFILATIDENKLKGLANALGENKSNTPSNLMNILLVTTLVVILLFLLYKLLNPILIERRNTIRTFNDFVKINNVTNDEVNELLKIAKFYGMKKPYLLFLDKDKIEAYYIKRIKREVGKIKEITNNLQQQILKKLFS